MTIHPTHCERARAKGFTLVEILISVVALGLLASVLASPVGRLIENAQYNAEREALQVLAKDVESSWSQQSQAHNIGMLSGQTGVTNPTGFDPDTDLNSVMGQSLTVTSQDNWRMKMATLHNMTYSVPLTMTYESTALSSVAFNQRRWTRLLIAGPTTEKVQRYLLVSLMTPASRQLKFPTSTTEGVVFDTMWNNAWNSAASTPPAVWESMLNGSSFVRPDFVLWGKISSGNRTNAGRFFVIPITQPKYLVTAVNTTTTMDLEVDIGPYTNAITIAANSANPVKDSSTITEFANGVPAGRWIVVRWGTPGNMVKTQQYPLDHDTTITVQ